MDTDHLQLSASWTWLGRASTAALVALMGLAVLVPAYLLGAPNRWLYALYAILGTVAMFLLESITNYDIRAARIDAGYLRLSWLGRGQQVPLSQVRVVGETSLHVGRLGRLPVVEVEYRDRDGRGDIVQFFPATDLSRTLLEQAITRVSSTRTSDM